MLNLMLKEVVVIKAMRKNIHLLILILFLSQILSAQTGEQNSHIVRKGDTLYSLSRKYNVSVDKIMELNNLSSPNQLKIGMNLKFSANNLDFNQSRGYIDKTDYIVKKGDTLYSISRSSGMTVPELLDLNGLKKGHVLSIGEKLSLKKREVPPVIADPIPAPLPDDKNLDWPAVGSRSRMSGKLPGTRIEADPYSYVTSIAAGKVVYAEPYRGFGNVILIDVEGYIYLYGGNEDIFVNVGEEVTAGTKIGRLGMSDHSNGKKDVFFSVFKDGKPVDTTKAPRG